MVVRHQVRGRYTRQPQGKVAQSQVTCKWEVLIEVEIKEKESSLWLGELYINRKINWPESNQNKWQILGGN